MSGHSKWSKIKHQKAASDAKKGKSFSKIIRLISLAAKKGTDPETNSTLRDAVNQARSVNMPSDNIERAIKKGDNADQAENLEEVRYEVFGPAGAAILIEGITDNKNRTLSEIKHLLSTHNSKLAEQGSVLWAFEKNQDGQWQPKHTIQTPQTEKDGLNNLLAALENLEDIQSVYTNAS